MPALLLTPEQSHTLAYLRGAEARRQWKTGQPWRHLNPHPRNSVESREWNRGWSEEEIIALDVSLLKTRHAA